MGVSRSGYYKWENRDKSGRDINRETMIALVSEIHEAHPSHGYRWVAAFLRLNYRRSCSDSYIYKVFRCLGIQSQTKHKPHYRPRKVRDLYPNLIFTTWETVDRPRQVIVSDMTVLNKTVDILFRTDTLFRCIYQTDSLLEAFESQRRTRAVSRWPFGCDRAVEWQQGADHYSY